EQPNITVRKHAQLASLTTGDRRIKTVTFTLPAGETLTLSGKVFIDGTYEGDLMAAAGVTWVIGREGRSEFNESFAGKQYPKKAMKFSGLDDKGNLLPFITAKDGGPETEGDKNVMVYSFRLCVTDQDDNKVPFPKPSNYDPARWEAVRRFFTAHPESPAPWDFYPLPRKKYDANNGIGKQFSMGIIGGGNGWCEADAAGRAKIWEDHKQYTLEYYHFLVTDPSVPEKIRKHFEKIGLCKDEFADYGHWSPQLYVREGRRMRGVHVITQDDILKTNTKPDSIAVASFPIDSHDCQRVARPDGTVIAEGTIFPFRHDKTRRDGPAYQVPYGAITPKENECSNLLVPVALSATHVAYSSIRVEPSWMVIGHSAGIAAAISAKDGKSVQSLDYAKLKERLHAQKQVTDLP
ncbi:MAG TPA: FAD-dependent oxidoreductase, partial [Luteolibacter sp.]|nr:FAD-dependent oxidoreductase [Luteolibacter sp.]